MNAEKDYLAINKKTWNEKTPVHMASDFYANDAFIKGKTSLNSIELNLLGDVSGKKILHLQCHFGQDSISLARMGAEVTGVDLSDVSIAAAKQLSADTNTNVRFIACDVYSLPELLDESFDIVFTTYGTIGWLPDMDKWAGIVNRYLKPGGSFVFAEFHPVVWMFDDDFSKVGYNYFKADAIYEIQDGTYTDRNAPIKEEFVTWNHAISEVLTALISQGLTIDKFEEFDYSPYNCFRHTEEFEPGKFRIAHLQNNIPMVYAIHARK